MIVKYESREAFSDFCKEAKTDLPAIYLHSVLLLVFSVNTLLIHEFCIHVSVQIDM